MSEDCSQAAGKMDVEDESPGISGDDGSGDSVVITGGEFSNVNFGAKSMRSVSKNMTFDDCTFVIPSQGDHDDSTSLSVPDREQEGSSVNMTVLSSKEKDILSRVQDIASVAEMDTVPPSSIETVVGDISTPTIVSGGVIEQAHFGSLSIIRKSSAANFARCKFVMHAGDTAERNFYDNKAITFKRIVKNHLQLMCKLDTIFPKFEKDSMLMPQMVARSSLWSGKQDYHEIELQDLHELLYNNKPNHVEITGEAGSGKTTAAKKYASLVLEGEIEALSDISLVHYVEAKNLQCDAPATAFDILFKQQIPDLQFYKKSCEKGEEWVHKNACEILLIIDGLDEFPEPLIPNCPVVYSATPAKATTIVANILSRNIWRGMKILTTSTVDSDSSRNHQVERTVKLKGFNLKNIKGLMCNALDDQVQARLRYHKLDKTLYPLCSNPATLTCIAKMLIYDDRPFPTTLSGFVVRALTRTFPSSPHSVTDLVQVARLAYHDLIDSQASYPSVEFSKVTLLPCITAYPVCGNIKIKFSHRLAQEIMAALYIFQLSRNEILEIVQTHFDEKTMEMVKLVLLGTVFNQETSSIVEPLFCGSNIRVEECQEILFDWLSNSLLFGAVTGMKAVAVLVECDPKSLSIMLENREIVINDARLSTSDIFTLDILLRRGIVEQLNVCIENTKIDPQDIQPLVECCQMANTFRIWSIDISLTNHQPTSDQCSAIVKLLPYVTNEMSIAGWDLSDEILAQLQESLNRTTSSKVRVKVEFGSTKLVLSSENAAKDESQKPGGSFIKQAAPTSSDDDEDHDCDNHEETEKQTDQQVLRPCCKRSSNPVSRPECPQNSNPERTDGTTGGDAEVQSGATPGKRQKSGAGEQSSINNSREGSQNGNGRELRSKSLHSAESSDPSAIRIKNAIFYDDTGHFVSCLWVTEKSFDQVKEYKTKQGNPVLLIARKCDDVTIKVLNPCGERLYKINEKEKKEVMVEDIVATGHRDEHFVMKPAPEELFRRFVDVLYTIEINGCKGTGIPFKIRCKNREDYELRLREIEEEVRKVRSSRFNVVCQSMNAQNMAHDYTIQSNNKGIFSEPCCDSVDNDERACAGSEMLVTHPTSCLSTSKMRTVHGSERLNDNFEAKQTSKGIEKQNALKSSRKRNRSLSSHSDEHFDGGNSNLEVNGVPSNDKCDLCIRNMIFYKQTGHFISRLWSNEEPWENIETCYAAEGYEMAGAEPIKLYGKLQGTLKIQLLAQESQVYYKIDGKKCSSIKIADVVREGYLNEYFVMAPAPEELIDKEEDVGKYARFTYFIQIDENEPKTVPISMKCSSDVEKELKELKKGIGHRQLIHNTYKVSTVAGTVVEGGGSYKSEEHNGTSHIGKS